MSAPILDKMGQEIKVGSLIVYGHALGRCAALQFGKVLAANRIDGGTRSRGLAFDDPDGYRITVQGVNDEMNWREERWEWKLLKKGTLQFPDRIIVLDAEKVPQPVRELLEGADVR